MEFSLLKSASSYWRNLLSRVTHDFYHLPSYVELEAERMGGEARAALVEEGEYFMLLPIVLRKLLIAGEPFKANEAALDAVSPYGYPCPLVSVPEDPAQASEFMREALGGFMKGMRSASIISLFVRMHPLLMPTNLDLFGELGQLVHHGQTVWLDLSKGEEELWQQTRKTYRNLIRRLEKSGFSVRIDSSWGLLPRFHEIYSGTMEAVAAAEWYYFGLPYFTKLRDALDSGISLCVVEGNGKIGAAGLFTECSGIVQYHLSGSDPDAEYKDATKLMLHFIRGWAKARGNRFFHLGGGVGSGADNLFFFKSGFSKLAADFYTWRIVTDQEIYREAVRVWEEKTGQHAVGEKDFFPAYRAPISPQGS